MCGLVVVSAPSFQYWGDPEAEQKLRRREYNQCLWYISSAEYNIGI